MVLLVGLLCSAWMTAFVLNAGAEPPLENEEGAAPLEQRADQNPTPISVPSAGTATELERWQETLKQKDKEHMLQVWRAIRDYKKAKGQLPDYLSDLVPEFLPEKEILLSPVENAYFRGASDPKLPTTYSYEFSVEPYGPGGLPFRSVKEAQMKEFGRVVPILRCFAHGEVVMNVSFDGEYYESTLFWERSTGAKLLMQLKGIGQGFEEGDFTDLHMLDGQTGAALPGVEVRLTNRYYHDLALPDRTLKTDAEGRVRVPLGPPPDRRLVVSVLKPGYVTQSQIWREKSLPVEKTWEMKPAATVGGVVTDREGRPLPEATVSVYAEIVQQTVASLAPGDFRTLPPEGVQVGLPGNGPNVPMRLIERCKTDLNGHWRCDRLPLNSGQMRFGVDHESAWHADFRSGGEGKEGTKFDRDALLAQEAEFKLEPAALVTGVLLTPDGKPLPGEEVSVGPARRAPKIVFTGARGSAQLIPKDTTTRQKTDEAGRFSLRWRAPGDLAVSATPAGFGMVVRVVQASPGMGPVELKASPRRKVAGRVHDANGRPVSGVVVTFIGWADVPAETRVAVTDEKGEFVWDTAPGGQIGLTFQGRGLTPSTEWISAGKAETMEVELRGLGRGEE